MFATRCIHTALMIGIFLGFTFRLNQAFAKPLKILDVSAVLLGDQVTVCITACTQLEDTKETGVPVSFFIHSSNRIDGAIKGGAWNQNRALMSDSLQKCIPLHDRPYFLYSSPTSIALVDDKAKIKTIKTFEEDRYLTDMAVSRNGKYIAWSERTQIRTGEPGVVVYYADASSDNSQSVRLSKALTDDIEIPVQAQDVEGSVVFINSDWELVHCSFDGACSRLAHIGFCLPDSPRLYCAGDLIGLIYGSYATSFSIATDELILGPKLNAPPIGFVGGGHWLTMDFDNKNTRAFKIRAANEIESEVVTLKPPLGIEFENVRHVGGPLLTAWSENLIRVYDLDQGTLLHEFGIELVSGLMENDEK